MIGKAKSCIGGTALANYVMKDVKGYELLRNNLSGMTPTQILQEMKIIQNLNQKAQYKTLSLVLSPEKTEGQKLTNKELQEMTLDFLKELKIDVKNQQYLAFVHTEKEHKHIHIICNRVKDDGTLVTDNFIGKNSLLTPPALIVASPNSSCAKVEDNSTPFLFKIFSKEIFNSVFFIVYP